MNTLEQQTFIDRLNNTEGALDGLVSYAENLANRLVGYADEGPSGFAENPAPTGYLPSVGDTASRMGRKVDEIRASLNRISQVLPAEKGVAAASVAGIGKQW